MENLALITMGAPNPTPSDAVLSASAPQRTGVVARRSAEGALSLVRRTQTLPRTTRRPDTPMIAEPATSRWSASGSSSLTHTLPDWTSVPAVSAVSRTGNPHVVGDVVPRAITRLFGSSCCHRRGELSVRYVRALPPVQIRLPVTSFHRVRSGRGITGVASPRIATSRG